MEKKYTAVLCALLLAFGAFMVLPPALADGDEGDLEVAAGRKGRWRPIYRWKVLRYILNHGEYTQVTGRPVVLNRHILVLEVDGDLENIVLPVRWVMNGQVYRLQELKDEYMGEEVTVDTLKITLEKEDHTVTAYFGYRITMDAGVAEAVLPFNISP